MPKFKVTLVQECTESGVVIVEAGSADEALGMDFDDLPDDFEFTYDDGNDYSKSRYVASCEFLPEEDVALNNLRAKHGRAVAHAHAANTGSTEDTPEMVSDCIANLLHFARSEGLDPVLVLRRANLHFNAEVLGIDDA